MCRSRSRRRPRGRTARGDARRRRARRGTPRKKPRGTARSSASSCWRARSGPETLASSSARVVVYRGSRLLSHVSAQTTRREETPKGAHRRATRDVPRTRRDSRTTWIPPRRATRRTLRDNPRRDALPVIFPKPSVPGDERRFLSSPRVTRQTPAGISLVAVVLSHISVIFPRATNHDEAAPWSPSPSAPVSPSFLVIIASRTEMSAASDPSASMRSFS